MKEFHLEFVLYLAMYSVLGYLIAFVLYPFFIRFVKHYKLVQSIRTEGLSGGSILSKLHLHKSGTPTMGGVIIIVTLFITVLISHVLHTIGWTEMSILSRGETYIPLFSIAVVGMLGVIDDWYNIREKSSQKGLSAKVKFWTLFAFAIVAGLWFVLALDRSMIFVHMFGNIDLGLLYLPFFIAVFLATSNSVNITDGLDGLAGGLLIIAYGVFGILAYFYNLPSLAMLCIVIVAILFAFLWFNVPPAQIYMGDTGSLSLGAGLGVIALMVDAIFVLVLVGSVFILETLSVILQLCWKKFFKKKLFLIAPIHHHFEKKGMSETQIMLRLWIVGIGSGMLGLLVGLFGR